ncbi:lipoyltransferase [Auriculariales sp. MPI-PUGE-AT-0066]|nr:lipoyltransferase [Auriculariales sp. MPI-PUGE-AT-0066]
MITQRALSPVLVHLFRAPLPYAETLQLQERIHALQLRLRKEALTESSSGRRQTVDEISADQTRLTQMGADFVMSNRGGQLTYHGPGQLVGYPLWDLGRLSAEKRHVRVFVCDVLKALKRYMRERHGIQPADANETGVFLNESTKLASLGMQVRHRLTSHGFAVNIDRQPLPWFSQVVACGLADVRAGSVQDASVRAESLTVHDEVPHVLDAFKTEFGRIFVPVDLSRDGELENNVRQLEQLGARLLQEQGLPEPPQFLPMSS